METGSKTSLKHPVTPYARGYILLDTVNRDILDSYTIWSENLSLTLEKKWCHAELGSGQPGNGCLLRGKSQALLSKV
jgi:hypothetical protein